jgi:3-oxoacyl-[acyl-carrier protein] reductase
MRFAGRAVLVTGSSRNIGKAIAEGFAREGASVVLNARESADELAAAAAELQAAGHEVIEVLADLGNREAVDDLVARGVAAFGKLDVLVINHSTRPHRPFLELTGEEWDEVLAANLDATFYLCKAVLPGMIERGGGSIVAVGGTTGRMAIPGKSHAAAALSGRNALLLSLIPEVGPHGVRINFVFPGTIDTIRKHPEWYPEAPGGRIQDLPELARQVALGRPGTSEEIAAAVLFVASDEAAYVNGAMVEVNGGRR